MANKKKIKEDKRTVRLGTLWSPNEIKSVGGQEKANRILAEARNKAYIESIEFKSTEL